MKKNLGIENPHVVPNLEKIVISSGIRSESDKGWAKEVAKEIAKISGQQPHRSFLFLTIESCRDKNAVKEEFEKRRQNAEADVGCKDNNVGALIFRQENFPD